MKSKTSHQVLATAMASGARARDRAHKEERLDTKSFLQALIGQYQRSNEPISVNFREILPALNSVDRFTHLIHPYPAKLLAHIPAFFLANELFSKPGDRVLDPFCGSGTVLLEAQLVNRRAFGVDANPLARLISRVKTTPLDPAMLQRSLTRLLDRIPATPSAPPPDVVNLSYWFYPRTSTQLRCLREAIDRIREPAVREFFLVSFSVCVRRASLADPRLSVPVRLKLGQYPNNHPFQQKSDKHLRNLRSLRVLDMFERVARANIARIARLPRNIAAVAPVDVLCSDARYLRHEYAYNGFRGKQLADESVQLVITSPPYPGAQKYIRSSSLSLGWLGLCTTSDLRLHKARTIGREEFARVECAAEPHTGIVDADAILASIHKRSPTRATIAATYLNEMRLAMRETFRVLKPGGYIVLIAANNHIANEEFRTVDYICTIGRECGLYLTARLIDVIKSRGLMTKRNNTASIITREWVLIFKKL